MSELYGQLAFRLRHLSPQLPQIRLNRRVFGVFAQREREPAIRRRKVVGGAQSGRIERPHFDHGFRVGLIRGRPQQAQTALAILRGATSVEILLSLGDGIVGRSRPACRARLWSWGFGRRLRLLHRLGRRSGSIGRRVFGGGRIFVCRGIFVWGRSSLVRGLIRICGWRGSVCWLRSICRRGIVRARGRWRGTRCRVACRCIGGSGCCRLRRRGCNRLRRGLRIGRDAGRRCGFGCRIGGRGILCHSCRLLQTVKPREPLILEPQVAKTNGQSERDEHQQDFADAPVMPRFFLVEQIIEVGTCPGVRIDAQARAFARNRFAGHRVAQT